MGKPIPKSLKNEVKCEGCKTGFRPEPSEKGRKFCYGCDPNNEGKVTTIAGKGDDVLYQDRAGKVDADIESLTKRVTALENRFDHNDSLMEGQIKSLEKKIKEETKKLET